MELGNLSTTEIGQLNKALRRIKQICEVLLFIPFEIPDISEFLYYNLEVVYAEFKCLICI